MSLPVLRAGKQTEEVSCAASHAPSEPFRVLVEDTRGARGAAANIHPSLASPAVRARCSALAPVLLYLLACLLLYSSWWCMYSAAKWPIAYAGTLCGSAVVEHGLWWSALLLEVVACELLLLRLLVVVPLRAVWRRVGGARGSCGTTTKPLPSTRLTAFFVFLVLVPFIAQVLIWTIVRSAIPRKYYQTYEVVYTLTRCLYDLLFLGVVTALLSMRALNRLVARCRAMRYRAVVGRHCAEPCGGAKDGSNDPPSTNPSLSYYFPSFLLFLVLVSIGTTWCVGTAQRMDAPVVMRGTVLGDTKGRSRDFCQVDGGTLEYAALRRAWVLTELLPHRFFNFYTGSTQCMGRVQLAYVDEKQKQLVVRATCPPTTAVAAAVASSGALPRVYLNLAPHNAFAQTDQTSALEELSDFVYHSYPQRTLQEKVHLHPVPGTTSQLLLQAVELHPRRLLATRRLLTAEERRRFPSWGREAVTVPLGQVVSHVVRCDGLDHEEVWLYPLDRPVDGEVQPFPVPHSGTLPKGAVWVKAEEVEIDIQGDEEEEEEEEEDEEEERPPMNLLVLMLDAVSRPEVLRSLPKWRQWLRDFQRRQVQRSSSSSSNSSRKGEAGHLVVEARAHTTIDHSTRPNLLATFAGTAEVGYDGAPRNDTMPPHETSVFTLAKARYGRRLHTALLVGYCEDYLKLFFRYPNATFGGFGAAVDGVDSYVFGPFCERRYAAMQSNFYGPYSVVRRCLGNAHVHEMALDYTRALVRQQLERVRVQASDAQEAFLYLTSLIDGHEGTHGVLYLLDEALTRFMQGLEEELHFFDDPRNGLLLFSDHGNHMGPYYMTYPGRLERALPFLVLVVHPSVLDTVDRYKGRPHGTAQANLLARTNGFTSPMDTYLTLCDLLRVPTTQEEAEVPPAIAASGGGGESAVWYPFSLLDALPDGMQNLTKLSRSGGYRTMYGALPRAAQKQAAQFCEFDA